MKHDTNIGAAAARLINSVPPAIQPVAKRSSPPGAEGSAATAAAPILSGDPRQVGEIICECGHRYEDHDFNYFDQWPCDKCPCDDFMEAIDGD